MVSTYKKKIKTTSNNEIVKEPPSSGGSQIKLPFELTGKQKNARDAFNKDHLVFDGAAKGMISRVNYFAYALTYTEIQYLMKKQPSTVVDSTDMSLTPYLSDTWWANKQGP